MNKQEAIRILGETTLLSPIGQAAYVAISALEKQLTNGWIPVSDKHPVKHEDELEEQFRNICQEPFKDCETEQDLNERYEELRQIIVCEMSDRAEELGIDPDTL